MCVLYINIAVLENTKNNYLRLFKHKLYTVIKVFVTSYILFIE